MGLNPLKWKAKTLMHSFLTSLVIYFILLYKKLHTVSFDFTIKNSNPEHVWEFVADFSNMPKLNPTIEEWSLVSESGSYDKWKYSVKYTEHLSYIPIIKNIANGYFEVKPENGAFLIDSIHHTCFLPNLICVNSVSKFKFYPIDNDTKCVETIEYECPLLFSFLCYKEVMYQRNEIKKNLISQLRQKNIRGE